MFSVSSISLPKPIIMIFMEKHTNNEPVFRFESAVSGSPLSRGAGNHASSRDLPLETATPPPRRGCQASNRPTAVLLKYTSSFQPQNPIIFHAHSCVSPPPHSFVRHVQVWQRLCFVLWALATLRHCRTDLAEPRSSEK